MLYGLYKTTSTSTYEGDCNTYESLMGVDDDPDKLKTRFNNKTKLERDKLKNQHSSYARHLPPDFTNESFSINYIGNIGGGYSSVNILVEIKEFKQFDDEVTND